MDLRGLFEAQQKGEITMNKAYRIYQNAGGEGSLKDFINMGTENGLVGDWNNADGKLKEAVGKAVQGGYVDQLFNTASAFLHTKFDSSGSPASTLNTPCEEGYEKDANGICQPMKKKISPWLWAGIGLVVVGSVVGIVYYQKNKK